ncbi:TPA: hypothetical protein ACWX8V_002437 [Klebsiella quasipneumoniae]|uniref:hypothetical protein n=1 Tax=Klebsiella pneumoniae TaxID=573 RepID=UPI000E2A76DD|nr:hypothetical protein [Klebsiella pneumoniae]MCC5676255.1 hypothetical protein [Klebsiella pneumoniae]MCP5730515.1 hypothetical protein [Klebsiella pneumoniae]MCP5851466.1 hypothetical protein [Klebsiella pneumoniae]MCP6104516.1 hypothetical protein [Klebsiella pneumoniae]MCY4748408.1 hypothetical protein [Klebsiella pneumoniae]
MTTDITELALIKGQKVEAPYYLAECTECGKMYSSSKLIVSRNYFDGDADCYCPHCNADDADIADLGSGEQPAVMAWNYQQARIDVLVEALEKAQQRNGELEAQNDYFASLVAMARVSADKAIRKFPQPNYVLLKVAEEAGEVVQAGVHYAENRMEWGQVEGEIVQLLAMLIRLVTEGDQVNGITPPALCSAGIKVEAE